ncbi:hypothetical protein EMCRGX_G025342 [Ephydatia muelleri]
MASRPLVLPDSFSGEGNWSQWIYHFENVAEVNEWEDAKRVLWLKVRLTGRAQIAYQQLSDITRANYGDTKKALKERFEPASQTARYLAEFENRRKKKTEGWADFAEDLRSLVEKAYPALQEEAKAQIALSHYLRHLDQPMTSFSVKQRTPKSLDEAVSATLEIESYQIGLPKIESGAVGVPLMDSKTHPEVEEAEIGTVASRSSSQLQDGLVHQLLQRLDKIEHELRRPERERDEKASDGQREVLAPSKGIRKTPNPPRITGQLGQGTASLIVDTGAGITLLRRDVWKGDLNGKLLPWYGCKLVGANGGTLNVVGMVRAMQLGLGGKMFAVDTVIVESLTSEGILGLDFLEKYECIIDAANGVLTLGDSGLHIQLQKATRSKSTEPALPVHVCLDDTIVIPPRSEVLTFATTFADVRGTWLVDEQTTKNNVAVRVARAIVHPQDSKVPVCLLNPRDVPVTMYKGMTIGEIEELRSNDVPVDNVQKANTVTKLDPKKRQMLLSLAETIGAHVSKEEQVQFSNLLLEYGDIFASSSTDLGRTGALKHCIKTGDSNPISQPVRRLPPHRKEQVNKLLHEMQENDIIHPSSSPWASPIVLVQKKDGSVWFCIDYRKLNAVTTKDAYPLPRIDDTLDTLCGSKWFSTLDLLSGYWQVEMSPEDRHKTAFCTPQGLFEFKVMPFGLCNAPATFQRLMDLVLAGLQWSKCLVYLDDVILLGTTFGEHLDNIRAVFDRIRQGGLKLRADKCCFLQRNVKYLGHLVGVDGLQVNHNNADALSRLSEGDSPQSNNITVVSIDSPVVEKRKVMREEQLQDDVVGPVLKAVESDLLPKKDELKQFSIGTRRLFQLWDQLKVKGGVLHRNFIGTKEVRPCLQLVVPMSQRKIVLAELHEGVTGGHLGQEKTLMKLKERFYWPGHWNNVQNWCNTCAACISRKTPAPKQRASLQSILVGQPMQLVAVDILGPLPESGNGNSYILVVGDYFTRWMEAYPIQNQEAVTVAQKLVDEIFCRFSVPEQLHSDQGRQFESAVIKEICNLLHIEKTRTTAYHPQSDGLVEQFNRTLLSMLTTCGRSHPFEWEDHIRKVCFAYNTSVQATTGYSPFFLMFGRQARLPIDLMYGTECGNSVTKTVPEYVTKLSEAFVEAYAAVRDTMGAKLQRQKEFYSKKVHGDPHKPGDFVLLFNPAVPKGGSRKFHSPWTGPFKIVERVSEATYHIQNTVDGKTSIVHFDRLKRCRPDIRTNIKQTKKDNSPTCGSTAGKDPPGTHMELLDDDQPTHVPEHPQPNAVLNEDPEPEEGPEQDDDDPHIIVPQPSWNCYPLPHTSKTCTRLLLEYGTYSHKRDAV